MIMKDGVTINGAVSAGNIVINASSFVEYGFRVNANQVTLTNLTVINTSGYGNAIRLENNLWTGLQIYNNYLGVLPGSTSCSPASGITSRPYFTILILGGTGMAGTGLGTAYIDNNVIGCSVNDGIANQYAPYVYIGRNIAGGSAGNWIGVSRGGANIGNGGRGISVCCDNVPTGGQMLGNHIAYNALEGIHFNRVSGATVSNNDIFNNGGAGIRLLNTSYVTLTNNTSHGNGSSGIWLDQTAPPAPLLNHDNHILGGAYYQNGAPGISESSYADANTWSQISTYANFGLGIDKKDNGIPDLPSLTLDSITPAAQGVLVNGTLTGSILIGNAYQVELYRIAADPSGIGEGRAYVGLTDVIWNFAGNYHFSIPDLAGTGCYTASLTESTFTSKTSSEYSANLGTQCNQVYLPAVVK
jgi:hypothetical protein